RTPRQERQRHAGVHARGQGRARRSQLWPAGRRTRGIAAHRRATGARTFGRTRAAGARCAFHADDRASPRRASTDRPVRTVVCGAGSALDDRARRIDTATGAGGVVPAEVDGLACALQRVDVAQCANEPPRTLVRFGVGRLVACTLGGPGRALVVTPHFRRLALLVQCLRNACLPAPIAKRPDFDLDHFLSTRDTQRITHPDSTGGFGALAADLDLAGIDRLARETARPEEACGPQPLVQPHAGKAIRIVLVHGPPPRGIPASASRSRSRGRWLPGQYTCPH